MHRKIVSLFSSFAIVATAWSVSSAQDQQPNRELISGFRLELSLRPGERHDYSVKLESGSALIAEADQEGIDLVVDVYGPDGKLLVSLDSPNGTEGPEPINFTAIQSGTYVLAVRAPASNGKPGKYLMKVDQILAAEENARRLARQEYPTQALYDLWQAYQNDSDAVTKFVASRKGKGPIIESLTGNNKACRVTYIYYGDENTEAVRTTGGPHSGIGGILMKRFLRTPLFFASETVPNDARYHYSFIEIKRRFVGPGGIVQLSEEILTTDALNPQMFAGVSVLEMPAAATQSYVVRNDSVPKGKLMPAVLDSTALKEHRNLMVYTPPGYDGKKACDLLIVFDGATYGGGKETDVLVPTPTILNNLLAAKKIGPTVAVLVPNMGQRERDLSLYSPFADFIATELVPWARKNYLITPGADHVVAAGSSLGGLTATFCALKHSEAIGNVLSQSGSFWVTKATRSPYPYGAEPGDMLESFRNAGRLPIRFYLEVGRFDAAINMLSSNRELRDVLQGKGYQVTYDEFDSGHDYVWWRGSLADGLIALIGRKSD